MIAQSFYSYFFSYFSCSTNCLLLFTNFFIYKFFLPSWTYSSPTPLLDLPSAFPGPKVSPHHAAQRTAAK